MRKSRVDTYNNLTGCATTSLARSSFMNHYTVSDYFEKTLPTAILVLSQEGQLEVNSDAVNAINSFQCNRK